MKMNKIAQAHLGWIDMLRIIACFFVVVSHCSDAFFVSKDPCDLLEGWGIGSIVRCSVPLFIMMSGVLLLPTPLSMRGFYSKRLKRLAVPLVFWSMVLPFLFYFYQNMSGGCKFPLLDSSTYTFKSTIYKSFTFFLNFNYDTTPLWYLYMLIGLYFIIPVLSTWIKNVSRKEIKTFLKIWGITLFVPYLEIASEALGFVGYPGNSHIFGVCDWNIFGTFYYVSGFIGYLLLGYYLKNYPLQWSRKKTLLICIPSFVSGVLSTFFSFILAKQYMPQYISFAWLFNTFNVFLITFPVFVIFQKINIKPSVALSRIASATFGIYLCHFFFIHVVYDLCLYILPEDTSPAIQIMCNSITTFAICYLLVRTMLYFKWTKRLVA